MVVAFYYGPFGKNEAGPIDEGLPSEVNTVAETPKVEQPAPTVAPSTPEPNQAPAPPKSEPAVTVTPEPAPQPGPEANPDAARLIAEATALIEQRPSRIIDARNKLNEALRMPMTAAQRASVKDQLSKLSEQWLFSRTVVPGDQLCESYLVKSGETLDLISTRYKVPWELLQQLNNVRPEALQAGQTIKVVDGPFHVKVYRSTFTMDLYLQNTYVRSFKVGLGKDSTETPTGLWRVKAGGKLIEPPWPDPISGKILHPGDPGYALGSRWMGLEGLSGAAKDRSGFGIHGTKEPETIGTASSLGCIRMHNGDAILLYNLLIPAYSTVEIVD